MLGKPGSRLVGNRYTVFPNIGMPVKREPKVDKTGYISVYTNTPKHAIGLNYHPRHDTVTHSSNDNHIGSISKQINQ